jgi:hypothetical protein
MTAAEYQELRLFLHMEFMPHEAIAMGLGIKPEDLRWKPNEQSDDEIIRMLEGG